MLTKDLLNYRKRKERVSPVFVAAQDPVLTELAEGLIEQFRCGIGSTLGDLDEEISEGNWADHFLTPAFKKLLADRCEEVDDDGAVAKRRWAVLQSAESLRQDGIQQTLHDFQNAVAAAADAPVASLKEQLYGDLAEFRIVKSFEPITPAGLLHRYNCAQVQGLLLHAQAVEVRLKGATIADKRRFFRCLKFQRLLSTVEPGEAPDEVVCHLSGPLKIFQNTQSYGMRLANFFPYVLQMPKWEMTAEVKLQQRVLQLDLDSKIGIISHYKMFAPVVPQELTAFIAAFNAKQSDYTAALGEEFINLGMQSYCCPDVTFTAANGAKVHLEIFHKWHAGQLAGRLAVLAEAQVGVALIIAVAQEVAADKAISPLLAASSWFDHHGFVFKNLPTPTALQQALLRNAAALPGKR